MFLQVSVRHYLVKVRTKRGLLIRHEVELNGEYHSEAGNCVSLDVKLEPHHHLSSFPSQGKF